MLPSPPVDQQAFVDIQCIVARHDNDEVSDFQLTAILNRHHIRWCSAGHGFNPGIGVFAPAKKVARILADEAPPNLFSLYIAGLRKFSEVALPWSRGKSIGQLNETYPTLKIADRWVKLGLPNVSKRGFDFRVRYYRGDDNKQHQALEVRLNGDPTILSHQFL
jgi:hypothetical protein